MELLAKGEEGEEEAERCVKGDVASLHSWCKSRLSRHSIPQEIVIMSKLPLLSSSGKVDIHSLPGTHLPFPVSKRKRFEEAKVSEASIFHAIAECLGHTHIEPSTNIFSLGASSLDAAEIADACGIDIFKVYQYPSVRQLFQYLASLDSNAIEGDKTRPKRATKDLNIVDYIPPTPKRYLHQNWKVSLSKCVDANPVLTANHVYTNSYGGDIVCCRIEDGQVVWRRENTVCQSLDVGLVWCPTLPPFESNLDSENSNDQESVHAVIAVTGNDGSLCFLDPRTGEDVSVNTDLREYGIRAVPAVDPWQHWVWIVTHRGSSGAARLVVIDPGNGRMIRSLSTLKLPAPSSSKVAFVNATDGCNCAYVACLDGSVLCTDTSRNNAILWNLKLDAPIFADPTPIVTSLHAGNPTALLVILTVKGRVSFITSRSGTIVWDYFLEGEGFFCSPAVQWCPNHSCVNFVATGLTFASRDGIITAIHELRNTVSQDTQKSNPRIKTFSTHMTITRIAFLFSKNTNTNSPSLLLMLTECGHLGLIDLRDGNIIDVYKLPASGAYGLSVKGTNVAIGCRDDCCYLLRVENLK